MKWLTDRLGVIFSPSAWITLGRVDHAYDAALNAALDQHGIERIGGFHAKVGDFTIWVSNYPYAYGHPSRESHGSYTLPRYATRKRIRSMLAVLP